MITRRSLLGLGLGALFGAASGLAHAADDDEAQRLLAASDAIRNPAKSFAMTTTLTEYRKGKETDANTLSVYSRPDAASGQFATLVSFAAPQRDAGKLLLKNGNDMWFYDPANAASIRISPEQRLLGQASNGDVATVNFAHDYRASSLGTEEISDGDRQKRQCVKLNLAAANDDVTYHRIEIWLDAASSRPVKARFYSETDRLLKTAFYRRYTSELGAERPTETVIIDGLDTAWVTVIRFSNYAWRDVPEAWLQRDYLPRFKAE